MSDANYTMIAETGDYVIIQDVGPWDKHKTVTNDADAVVAELTKMLDGRKLYYFDSNDACDQLAHDGKGHFLRFEFGGPFHD